MGVYKIFENKNIKDMARAITAIAVTFLITRPTGTLLQILQILLFVVICFKSAMFLADQENESERKRRLQEDALCPNCGKPFLLHGLKEVSSCRNQMQTEEAGY